MNKLLRNINQSAGSVRFQRAAIVAQSVINCQQNLVNNLRNQVGAIEIELARLLDFGPQQTTDLSVGSANFRPEGFVNTVHATRCSLRDKRLELEVAESTLEEWQEDDGEANVEAAIGDQPPAFSGN